MGKASTAAAAVIGAGAGLAIGYFLPQILPKPKVTISPNPITAGQTVTFTFSGFPPNTGLVSFGYGTNAIGSAETTIGTTDSTGTLIISGAAPSIPSGTVILYVAMVAANPTIYATTNYYVS